MSNRTMFYVDVGDMEPEEASEVLKTIKDKFSGEIIDTPEDFQKVIDEKFMTLL